MKKILLLSVTIIIAAFITTALIINKNKTTKLSEEITVKTCRPQFENVYSDIESFGTVFYKTKTEVTCLVPGSVIEKKVKEGDQISKGQILYKLKNVELEIENTQNQNNVNSSLANLKLYQAKLDEKEKEINAKLLSINNLQSEIQISENNLKLSSDKLEKCIDLNKIGGVTDQELIEMKNQIETLKTQIEIQKRELKMNSLGFTKEDLIQNGITPSENPETFKKQIILLNTKTSRADLEVAQAEYDNSKASLALTEKLLNDLTIRSPVTGVIGAVYHESGEYITQNEKLATVIDITTCVAEMNIQENNIYSISIGNRAQIEIPSIGKTIDTFISDISPIADSQTGNFFVKADFANTENLIKPGMYLKCSIANNSDTRYLKIPETALINATEKTADCFIVQNDVVFLQKIKIAFIKNGFAFIDSGITEKQQIISNPSKKLKDGTYVKVL